LHIALAAEHEAQRRRPGRLAQDARTRFQQFDGSTGSGTEFGTTATRARGANVCTNWAQPSDKVITSELASSVWRIQRRNREPASSVAKVRKPPPCRWKMVLQPASRAISSTSDLRRKLACDAACTWTTAGCRPTQVTSVCQNPAAAPRAFTSGEPSRWVAT
jgi:hypothetical protein